MTTTHSAARGSRIPSCIVPPARPLPRWRFFPTFIRNPLLVLPQAVYEEPIVRYDAAARPMCWVSDPDLVKTVLLDQRDDFPKTSIEKQVLGSFLGDGILTTDGEDWKWQRQTLAPLFRPADMLSFVGEMTEAAEATIANWRSFPSGQVRQIDQDMKVATFDVISSTMIPGGSDYARSAMIESDDMMRGITWPIALAMLGAPSWFPHPGKSRMDRARQNMRARVTDLVRVRRSQPGSRHDILARLVGARHPVTGEAMSDSQIVDNVLTFLAAGHETTAKALTWALYLLAWEPEWQERLFAEVETVAGSSRIEGAHIDRLKLTTQVVKEAMRLYPPAPVLTRVARRACTLGSESLPAGTLVVMSIYAIHRHRARWPDADAFMPDRFATEKEANIPRYQYMPFGAGPRICIGASFAMIEAVAMLATFVRGARYSLGGAAPPVPISRVTLRPRDGMPLTVHVR